MRTGIRFRPPQVELSAELEWVFARAFGPATVPHRAVESARAVDLARAFGLAERIGSRARFDELEAELGSGSACSLRDAATQAAVLSMLVKRVCLEIAELGSARGVHLVFLKGAALQIAGTVAPGSRTMSDVDVLVAAAEARTLQEALRDRGCAAFEVPESDHQLQLLTHPNGLGIEVHHRVPGLRLRGGRSATAEDLLDAGRILPAPGLPEGCFVPDREAMLAHLLVHGLAQHGLTPGSYPMARMLADVQDTAPDPTRWHAFLAEGMRWIERDVSRHEVAAVRALVERLGQGEAPAGLARDGHGCAVLMRHVVAGVVDESYGRSMRIRSLTAKPRDVGRLRGLLSILRHTVLPTRGQIDILYGPPRTELGYWGWRLWRPFDLAGRAWRYGRAWLEHRRRVGGP